jgi:hypothetical protein
VQHRYAEYRFNRLPALTAELVRSQVTVIVIAALFVAAVSEALLQRSQEGAVEIGIGRAQKSDHRQRRLLRPRHPRPRCRTPEPRDEFAPPHPSSLLPRHRHPIAVGAAWERPNADDCRHCGATWLAIRV